MTIKEDMRTELMKDKVSLDNPKDFEIEECEHSEVIKKGNRLFCEVCKEYLTEKDY